VKFSVLPVNTRKVVVLRVVTGRTLNFT